MEKKLVEEQLQRGMKTRHLMMIAIGGTISASFFLGVGDILSTIGAFGTVLAFIFGGFVMFLALISLAEMAVAMPISGSFQAYATRFISPLAGFVTGWLYLVSWVTAAAASLTASSIIMLTWFPSTSAWEWSLLFMLIIGALNLFPVKAFGEVEFWFAGIKIVAIIGFILVAFMMILGIIPHSEIVGFKNFYTDGLFPNGITPFLFGMVMVVCTYQGAELVGITAGESENPEKNVKRAIKNVGLRILLFFVISIFMIALILPWRDASVGDSPFTTILQQAKIPYICFIMQLVIIAASLSAVNSAFYACARFLWSMSRSKQAPRFYAHTNRYGVPYWGVIVTVLLSGLCLISKFIGVQKVFLLIVASSGMVGCLIWIMISWCHINFRRYLRREGMDPNNLGFKVRFYPLIPLLSILLNLLVVVGMLYDPSQRMVVYFGICLILFFIVAYFIYSSYLRKTATN